jgi:hypothetical protein
MWVSREHGEVEYAFCCSTFSDVVEEQLSDKGLNSGLVGGFDVGGCLKIP